MKLLAFLGLSGRYEAVNYTWQGQSYQTRFSTAAACHFLQPDEVVVFVTDETKKESYPELIESLPEGIPVNPVPIPLGADDAELWDLFSIITRQVPPETEVAFDITNGLRLFPLVGLLAAAFLHAARSVSLKAVLYGAFDLRKNREDGSVPMFDLSPMVSLFDWTLAAERFTQFGDSERLAALLMAQKDSMARQAAGDQERLAGLSKIGRLASAMGDVSRALDLIRPDDVFSTAARLEKHVPAARSLLETTPNTQPFVLLLDQVHRSYAELNLESDQPEHRLANQYRLVCWYLSHKYWVHTVTLARELMVNWFLYCLGDQDWLDKERRSEVEVWINHDAWRYKTCKQEHTGFKSEYFSQVVGVDKVLDTWNQLTDIRNDIDHAGHRRNPVGAVKLMGNIRKTIDRLGKVLNL